MGRIGNIGSQVVSCRVPTKLFTKLHLEADDKGIAIGVHIREVLSKENFSQGGQTEIEYRDRIVEKKIEVPVYRDRIIEKKVEIDNPKISQENVALKKQIELLELEIKKLTPKKYTTSPTKNQEECHPDYEWFFAEKTGEWIVLRKFEGR